MINQTLLAAKSQCSVKRKLNNLCFSFKKSNQLQIGQQLLKIITKSFSPQIARKSSLKRFSRKFTPKTSLNNRYVFHPDQSELSFSSESAANYNKILVIKRVYKTGEQIN